MHARDDLLIEIGTEELPPTALRGLSLAFRDNLSQGLTDLGLTFSHVEVFATPRRLACLIHDLTRQQPDQTLVRRGPSVESAFDQDGQPTKAALGFAGACGVPIADLAQEQTDKGLCLVARRTLPGKAATELIPELIERALAMLPIAKRMRWADRNDEFVRPVHWVCLVFGTQPLTARILGVDAGNETRGHRFHHRGPITIAQAGDYAQQLRAHGFVEPCFARRRAAILDQVAHLPASLSGRVDPPPELLDEVTALCEWPHAILGRFDEEFLELPAEVLIETMQKNQRYFPVYGPEGGLLPRFVAIANIASRDPEVVRAGNERVLRPRFADAAFFWRQDLKQPLEAFCPGLEQVVFQKKLGSMADKTRRVARAALPIAEQLGAEPGPVVRAARLAKCDLMTQMIFELPALQGVMGRHYALRSGENEAVAEAIAEQYLPRHAGDLLPKTLPGQILSLAERLDTLVGIFAIGQRPTGVKDPYALRRSAIGVVRLMIEVPLDLDLRELLECVAQGLAERLDAGSAAAEVFDYILDRLRHYYQEQGIGSDSVEAVTSLPLGSLADMDRRIRAIETFRGLPEAASLVAANKRIRNILRQGGPTDGLDQQPDSTLLAEPSERTLTERLTAVALELQPLIREKRYLAALEALARLHDTVNAFFDEVLVMAPEPGLRSNRLRLLAQLERSFCQVADISRLQL